MDDLPLALRHRLRDAIARSELLVARSKVIASARRLIDDPERMPRRCAWCGRLRLGGQWIPTEDAPAFVRAKLESRATHGICTRCVRRLEQNGRSHEPSATQ